MKIILSPAKTMNIDTDTFLPRSKPVFINEAKEIVEFLKTRNYEQLKGIWKCSDKLIKLNIDRLETMDLEREVGCAVFAYEGLAYQHLAANVLDEDSLEYLEGHLRVLSGLYGSLRPFDGVTAYRLEMQAKMEGFIAESLYEFWGDKIAYELSRDNDLILNLASKEYSSAVLKHLPEGTKMVTCIFGYLDNGKVKEKGTLAKIARGEMVRFLAENKVGNLEGVKEFNVLGYEFKEELSRGNEIVFIK